VKLQRCRGSVPGSRASAIVSGEVSVSALPDTLLINVMVRPGADTAITWWRR
jgi:hypothetical protein